MLSLRLNTRSRRALCWVLFATLNLVITPAMAKGPSLDLLAATPIGSWQIREDYNTSPRGKRTVSVVKTSMLGEETRNGERYYWVEMVQNEFKLRKSKKGEKRKPTGDQIVTKTLLPASTFTADPANAIANLSGVGEEMIIQTGNSDPIIMRGAGALASSFMQGSGGNISFDFAEQGTEQVAVTAGTFDTTIMSGTGSVTVDAVFKQITVTSKTTGWYSEQIPFGIVKSTGETTTNGKTTTNESQLIEYGMSGATSLITKTPQEMPNLEGLLGGGSN